ARDRLGARGARHARARRGDDARGRARRRDVSLGADPDCVPRRRRRRRPYGAVSSFGRVVVGMASADGISYGVRALEVLRDASAEIHLVMTRASETALGTDLGRVRSLAEHVYA